ncbi:MAG: TIGR02452 family protein [Ruminococcaceae bacterium]|nr:TIGR02452 family protein [Oscillospiraceae bacterium]
MTTYELIAIFEDTQNKIIQNPFLQEQMMTSKKGSQLYLDNYTSPIRRIRGDGNIEVVENTTFQCARELHPRFSKIAVLNFANPHEPGGGVRRGAMAQEECLCRCSTLYNVLAQPYFLKHYYQYHYQNCDYFFSDRLIYSPDITVFKSDDRIPQNLDAPFRVDVITCTAPYINGSMNKSDNELMAIYKSRIRNILEVAMSKEVDCLILGAFGCGAFHNDPNLMSKAFAELLVREKYAGFFNRVVFAIKRTGDYSHNLYSFQKTFHIISAEGNKRRF